MKIERPSITLTQCENCGKLVEIIPFKHIIGMYIGIILTTVLFLMITFVWFPLE